MGIGRRLKEIGQDMDPMTTREDLAFFLKKPENAQKLNGLVQDIRYAVMDYQVCTPKGLALVMTNICSDFGATRYLQRGLSEDCESRPLAVPPSVITCK